jgi:hypothetical protein
VRQRHHRSSHARNTTETTPVGVVRPQLTPCTFIRKQIPTFRRNRLSSFSKLKCSDVVWMRLHVSPKRWYLPANQHGAQNTDKDRHPHRRHNLKSHRKRTCSRKRHVRWTLISRSNSIILSVISPTVLFRLIHILAGTYPWKTDGCLLGCSAVQTDASLPTFQRSVISAMNHPPDDGGRTDLWNAGKLTAVYTALQTRRQPSWCRHLLSDIHTSRGFNFQASKAQ